MYGGGSSAGRRAGDGGRRAVWPECRMVRRGAANRRSAAPPAAEDRAPGLVASGGSSHPGGWLTSGYPSVRRAAGGPPGTDISGRGTAGGWAAMGSAPPGAGGQPQLDQDQAWVGRIPCAREPRILDPPRSRWAARWPSSRNGARRGSIAAGATTGWRRCVESRSPQCSRGWPGQILQLQQRRRMGHLGRWRGPPKS